MIKFKIEHTISKENLINLLTSAFEGGANYWYDDLRPIKETSSKRGPDGFYDNMVTNGFILKDKETGKTHKVTANQFKKAFILMSKNWANHFSDFVNECEDATTGDVFLQLIVFKDVIYG